MSNLQFSTLNLKANLLENVNSLGYTQMTPIQAKSLPIMLKGTDVIAQAKTGSGKTAAFALALLEKLDVKQFAIQSIVLCPTRELADQVAKEIRQLARTMHNVKVLTLCGGMPFGPQVGSLSHGAHIIVGTPGRIEDHLRKQTLKLDHVTIFVLDEADRMLEMGFQEALDAIVNQIPKNRQTLLFSATYSDQVKNIAKSMMKNPITITAEETHDDATIDQHFYLVNNDEERIEAVRLLLLKHNPESTIVFCNTKHETEFLADALSTHGVSVMALHGDLEQRDRTIILTLFSNKSVSVLVATDVAARGLDIDSVAAVINYHIAKDPEVHVHRIGRTGRAGNFGLALSFYSKKEDYKIKILGEYINKVIENETLPPKTLLKNTAAKPKMKCIQIDAGKKQKLRAGDILGALTGEKGISATDVGKITIFDFHAYVAVSSSTAKQAIKILTEGKIKGRAFRARLIT
ncbi:MAG: ATP-dependent RNA helicase DbpA [Gammaproteobacteria bacterium]|nr:ATP-dependent RNA helicase DbpA [Gammaproteobacteria bacterium]